MCLSGTYADSKQSNVLDANRMKRYFNVKIATMLKNADTLFFCSVIFLCFRFFFALYFLHTHTDTNDTQSTHKCTVISLESANNRFDCKAF